MRERHPIDRASDADLAFLAMDRDAVPQQIAVVLLLDRALPEDACLRLLGDRSATVPRLRQRLIRTPLGCGRPIWVEDDGFDPRRQVNAVPCAAPEDTRALLDAVMPYVLRPLPRDRPLWRAVLVRGPAGGCAALAMIVHHVLSDGLGGLAALDRLLDEAVAVTVRPPARRPAPCSLAADAWRSRLTAWRRVPARLRRMRSAMAAGGGVAPAPVARCSLLRATGALRRSVAVRVPLDALRDAAHRHDAGVHAALLTAVAGALRVVLDRRGETIGAVTIAVPVGTPRPAGETAGNAVSPLIVTVPVTGPPGRRLARVAAEVRRRRAAAAGPAPITVLGGWFRLIAALGGYRWYMTHQKRLHTLVSFVRGPAAPVRLGGAEVRAMIPIAVGGATNVTVAFLALSYAGTLTVTAVADPVRCPDLDLLGRVLAAELAAVAAGSASGSGEG
ncbi:wax ester/triacylglycerol synthase domain-containing protein [Actinoplanes sp. NPDC049668]|uniref:wax ester/triacylglycerol synthase domain-containing protein n=1 Tax=unclassified Actinoplanes TaxID=2626549 RepID=UPI0033AD98CE